MASRSELSAMRGEDGGEVDARIPRPHADRADECHRRSKRRGRQMVEEHRQLGARGERHGADEPEPRGICRSDLGSDRATEAARAVATDVERDWCISDP